MDSLPQQFKKIPKTTLALFVFLVASLNNYLLEKKKQPTHYGPLLAYFHTVLFIIRHIPETIIKRVTKQSKTPSWTVFEEVAMNTVRFHGKLSDVYVPNYFLRGLSHAQRTIARSVGGMYVEDIRAQALGFGMQSSGRKRFGKNIECTGEWITLDGQSHYSSSNAVSILYFHGGGFAIGNSGMYLAAFGKLLKELRELNVSGGILSIEYPMAPKVKHPIPTQCCLHVYEYLVREARIIGPERLIIAGDSAGGSIALNIALKSTKWGSAGVCLFSPWVGHTLETKSHQEFADVDLIGGQLTIEKFQEAHVQGGKEKSVMDDSLHVFQDDNMLPLTVLPPVFMTVGEYEVFKDDILRFATMLEQHNVCLELFQGAQVPHIFPMLYPLFLHESSNALRDCADFMVECFQKAKEESRILSQDGDTDVMELRKVLSKTNLNEMSNSDVVKIKKVLSKTNLSQMAQDTTRLKLAKEIT